MMTQKSPLPEIKTLIMISYTDENHQPIARPQGSRPTLALDGYRRLRRRLGGLPHLIVVTNVAVHLSSQRPIHRVTVTQFLHTISVLSRHDVGQALRNVCYCDITFLVR